MKNPNNLQKVSNITLLICFVFWTLAKIPNIAELTFFGAMYQLLVYPMIAITALNAVVALILWLKSGIKLFSIEYFSFLLSVATLIIMRFV